MLTARPCSFSTSAGEACEGAESGCVKCIHTHCGCRGPVPLQPDCGAWSSWRTPPALEPGADSGRHGNGAARDKKKGLGPASVAGEQRAVSGRCGAGVVRTGGPRGAAPPASWRCGCRCSARCARGASCCSRRRSASPPSASPGAPRCRPATRAILPLRASRLLDLPRFHAQLIFSILLVPCSADRALTSHGSCAAHHVAQHCTVHTPHAQCSRSLT